MDKLLPDRLRELWQSVERREMTAEAFASEQERLLDGHRRTWTEALRLEGHRSLEDSLLAELALYMHCTDLDEIRARCTGAVARLKREWEAGVRPEDPRSIERFYDESQTVLYELMWWHGLADDSSPLAYVTALQFARQGGCRRYLDFGSGVGSGAILFARHGFDVTLADISSSLLRFAAWRLERRGLAAYCVDLKSGALPPAAFDFVTAMDVFEHLVDPVATVDQLWQALVPGGYLYARIAAEDDPDRPQHIVHDFGPTLARLQARGFVKTWQDEWLWGHQIFQRA
jgi:SAM-dependent methyltransferase